MLYLKESDAVRLAMEKSKLNQRDFAKKISKSQAQISKYISGESKPSSTTYIRCMNILSDHSKGDGSLLDLINEASELSGEKHLGIRSALIEVIRAYKSGNH